ncbi:MAG TPA: hypothetical protein ENF76_03795 [Candidatus Bathyarchaeota archaeon]|nr:MAG: hypothetical protein DRO34_05035 [Candidatus Bathyarchaeota archaeon]HDI07470.1 hypothetical protein [Candidatus Bathyarchaeota archaeon]
MSKIEWSALLELVLLGITVGAYPFIVILAMVYMGAFYGPVGAWSAFAALLSPLIAVWYYVLSKRRKRSEEALKQTLKGYKWNVEKTAKEYLEMVEKKGKRKE